MSVTAGKKSAQAMSSCFGATPLVVTARFVAPLGGIVSNQAVRLPIEADGIAVDYFNQAGLRRVWHDTLFGPKYLYVRRLPRAGFRTIAFFRPNYFYFCRLSDRAAFPIHKDRRRGKGDHGNRDGRQGNRQVRSAAERNHRGHNRQVYPSAPGSSASVW